MTKGLRWPILGTLAAIAITTAMDAGGLSAYSALPLLPLIGLFGYAERLPLRRMGFVWGDASGYRMAVLYPVAALGALALAAAAAGAIDLSQTNWAKAFLNFALVSLSTIVVAILTEEGFFRGWLWASLERAGVSARWRLLGTSVAFALWHVSAATLATGFAPPARQVPIFLLNAAVVGAVWGLLRGRSGSAIVSSVSHGLWNGGAYVFFGYGARVGALGIRNTAVFGPEVGILGLAVNLAIAVAFWRWARAHAADSA